MVATLRRVAAPVPAVDLDTRLALAGAGMDALLAEAALAFDVNTAFVETPAFDPATVLPLTPVLAPTPAPGGPVAAHLRRARQHMATVGWATGRRRDEAGAVCALGALYATAGGSSVAGAAAVLLDAIQREFPNAETVPSWSDRQGSAGPVLRMLDRAANLADQKGN